MTVEMPITVSFNTRNCDRSRDFECEGETPLPDHNHHIANFFHPGLSMLELNSAYTFSDETYICLLGSIKRYLLYDLVNTNKPTVIISAMKSATTLTRLMIWVKSVLR